MKIRQRGWSVVRVEGLSMIPTLAPDERALVHWGAEVGLGDVVVAQRMDRPELLLVKRLVRSACDSKESTQSFPSLLLWPLR